MLRSAAASSWQLPGREVLMEKATRRGQPRMGQQDFTYRVGGLGPAKNAEGIAYLRIRCNALKIGAKQEPPWYCEDYQEFLTKQGGFDASGHDG